MTRKTISVSETVKKEFDDWRKDKPTNQALVELLENHKSDNRNSESGRKNIHITQENYEKLVRCRVYRDEPFSSVIYRLLSEQVK